MADSTLGIDLASLTIREARRLLDGGHISSEELTRSTLSRMESLDGDLNAYVTVERESALRVAREFDTRRASGEMARSPLDGIPMGIKDVLATAGVRTTCGSRQLEGYVPPFSATAVRRLRDAGAVLALPLDGGGCVGVMVEQPQSIRETTMLHGHHPHPTLPLDGGGGWG